MKIDDDKINPSVFYTRFLCEDMASGEKKLVKGVMFMHLCPSCNDTHFELVIGTRKVPMMSFVTTFKEEEAEALAAELNCPRILAE